MQILIYNTPDINRKTTTKSLTLLATVSGNLKKDTSVIDPVIEFSYEYGATFPNYIYIPTFRRYYFITDVILKPGHITEVHLHVDVLQTYRTSILGGKGVVTKTTLTSKILNELNRNSPGSGVIQNPGVACGAKTMVNQRSFPGAAELEKTSNWILTVLG